MTLTAEQSLYWSHLCITDANPRVTASASLESNPYSRRSLHIHVDESLVTEGDHFLTATVHHAEEFMYLSDYSVYLSEESLHLNDVAHFDYHKTKIDLDSNGYPEITATYHRGDQSFVNINLLDQQRDEIETARAFTTCPLPTIDDEGYYRWIGKVLLYSPLRHSSRGGEGGEDIYTLVSIPNGITLVDLYDKTPAPGLPPLLESVFVPSLFSGELPTLLIDQQMQVATQVSIAHGLLLAIGSNDTNRIISTLLGVTNLVNPLAKTHDRVTRLPLDSNLSVVDSAKLLWSICKALYELQRSGLFLKFHLGPAITSRLHTVISQLSLALSEFVDESVGWCFIGLEDNIPIASFTIIGSLWTALALGLSLELDFNDDVYKRSFSLQSSILNSISDFNEENFSAFTDGKDRQMLPLLLYWQLANTLDIEPSLLEFAKGLLITDSSNLDLSLLMTSAVAAQLGIANDTQRQIVSNFDDLVTILPGSHQVSIVEESLLRVTETNLIPEMSFEYHLEECNLLLPLLNEWQHYFWPYGDGWQSPDQQTPVLSSIFHCNTSPFLKWAMDFFLFSDFILLLESQGPYTKQWADIAQLMPREFVPNTVWRSNIYSYLNRSKNSIEAVSEASILLEFNPTEAFTLPQYQFVKSWEDPVSFDYFPSPDLKLGNCPKHFDPDFPSSELYPYIFVQPTFRYLTNNLPLNDSYNVLDIINIERPNPGFTNYVDLSIDISVSSPFELTLDGYFYVDLLSNYVGVIYVKGIDSSPLLMRTLSETVSAGIRLVVDGFSTYSLSQPNHVVQLN